MKLPNKKYPLTGNDELNLYAFGWNSIIEKIEIEYSSDALTSDALKDECIKEALLKTKKNVCDVVSIPFFKGEYDCIVEIEKLNKEEV